MDWYFIIGGGFAACTLYAWRKNILRMRAEGEITSTDYIPVFFIVVLSVILMFTLWSAAAFILAGGWMFGFITVADMKKFANKYL